MQIVIQNVAVEVGKPGPRGWSKAVVSYLFNGQQRTQNLMSFTNPQVYKDVVSGQFTGVDADVTVTKNAKGYDEWAAITLATGTAQTAVGGSNTGQTTARVVGSNYETREERARRQVLIVKQSSLTAALKYLELTGANADNLDPERVTDIAQDFTDWVMDDGEDINGEAS